jgi:hypothetical protein
MPDKRKMQKTSENLKHIFAKFALFIFRELVLAPMVGSGVVISHCSQST